MNLTWQIPEVINGVPKFFKILTTASLLDVAVRNIDYVNVTKDSDYSFDKQVDEYKAYTFTITLVNEDAKESLGNPMVYQAPVGCK